VLERFRSDEMVATFSGGFDSVATTQELQHVASLLPSEWLAQSATGTPEQCAVAVHAQLEFGCDGVIMHGATPHELAPVVGAYRASYRPATDEP
jgi:5,10-methylenetetrahydromethanopterin reductase